MLRHDSYISLCLNIRLVGVTIHYCTAVNRILTCECVLVMADSNKRFTGESSFDNRNSHDPVNPVSTVETSTHQSECTAAPPNGGQGDLPLLKKKPTSFQITSVTVQGSRMSTDGGDDSADDLDESHTEDLSSDVLDLSRTTDVDNDPLSEENSNNAPVDIVKSISVKPVLENQPSKDETPTVESQSPPQSSDNMQCIPTTVLPISAPTDDSNTKSTEPTNESVTKAPTLPSDHWQRRFKVVKIVSSQPYKRGRWLCMDFMDPPSVQSSEAKSEVPAEAMTNITVGSGGHAETAMCGTQTTNNVAHVYEIPPNESYPGSISVTVCPQPIQQPFYGIFLPLNNSQMPDMAAMPSGFAQDSTRKFESNVPSMQPITVGFINQPSQLSQITSSMQQKQTYAAGSNKSYEEGSAQSQSYAPQLQTQPSQPATQSQNYVPQQQTQPSQPATQSQNYVSQQQTQPPQPATQSQNYVSQQQTQPPQPATQSQNYVPQQQTQPPQPATQSQNYVPQQQTQPATQSQNYVPQQQQGQPPQPAIQPQNYVPQQQQVQPPPQQQQVQSPPPPPQQQQQVQPPQSATQSQSYVPQQPPQPTPQNVAPQSQQQQLHVTQSQTFTTHPQPSQTTQTQSFIQQPPPQMMSSAPSIQTQAGGQSAHSVTDTSTMQVTQAQGISSMASSVPVPQQTSAEQMVPLQQQQPPNAVVPPVTSFNSPSLIHASGVVPEIVPMTVMSSVVQTMPTTTEISGNNIPPVNVLPNIPDNLISSSMQQTISKEVHNVPSQVHYNHVDARENIQSSATPAAAVELLSEITASKATTATEETESAPGGSNTVAIDNKIEQAMDLVKSHLMFAVREEVDVLKEKITELVERISLLEYENTFLKANASQETLSQLNQSQQLHQQQQQQQQQTQNAAATVQSQPQQNLQSQQPTL